jgi:hypothetical protein
MQESVETPGEFVVARSDATKLLESIEETFNQMARLVAMPVGCPPLSQLRFTSLAAINLRRDLHALECANAGISTKKGLRHDRNPLNFLVPLK